MPSKQQTFLSHPLEAEESQMEAGAVSGENPLLGSLAERVRELSGSALMA